MTSERQYHSYLLRIWQAGNGHAPEWRVSLEDVLTHERHVFADPEQLGIFLAARMRDDSQPAQNETLGPE